MKCQHLIIKILIELDINIYIYLFRSTVTVTSLSNIVEFLNVISLFKRQTQSITCHSCILGVKYPRVILNETSNGHTNDGTIEASITEKLECFF